MLYYIWRYLALERADRRLLWRAYIWLAAMDIALRVVGFRRLIRQPAALTEGSASPDALYRAERYARWLAIASRHHVVRARCLQRSLVLHHWLCRDGLPNRLRIGVRKGGGALQAHAWVEIGGIAVNERPAALATFVPLARPHALRPWSDHDGYGDAARPSVAGIWKRQERGAWV